MKRTLICLYLASLWLVTGVPTFADNYPSTPKDLVETYMRLDAEAAGLSPTTWPELGHYTNFPQAPKWETFVVIDHYNIDRVMEGHSRAQVRVTYHPLGRFSDKFVPGTTLEPVIFYLNKIQDQWKVDSPPIMPHVSFEVMKKRLETNSATSPKDKKANDALIQQIESVRSTLK